MQELREVLMKAPPCAGVQERVETQPIPSAVAASSASSAPVGDVVGNRDGAADVEDADGVAGAPAERSIAAAPTVAPATATRATSPPITLCNLIFTESSGSVVPGLGPPIRRSVAADVMTVSEHGGVKGHSNGPAPELLPARDRCASTWLSGCAITIRYQIRRVSRLVQGTRSATRGPASEVELGADLPHGDRKSVV